jgi:hypothetical protein
VHNLPAGHLCCWVLVWQMWVGGTVVDTVK